MTASSILFVDCVEDVEAEASQRCLVSMPAANKRAALPLHKCASGHAHAAAHGTAGALLRGSGWTRRRTSKQMAIQTVNSSFIYSPLSSVANQSLGRCAWPPSLHLYAAVRRATGQSECRDEFCKKASVPRVWEEVEEKVRRRHEKGTSRKLTWKEYRLVPSIFIHLS